MNRFRPCPAGRAPPERILPRLRLRLVLRDGPLLVIGGPLAPTVGHVLGVGPWRGIGLLFITLGTFVVLISASAFLSPRLRLVDEELPDATTQIRLASLRDGAFHESGEI